MSTTKVENQSAQNLNPNLEIDEQELGEMMEQHRRLKRTLKQLSKNQLIQLLLEQVNQTIEQQNVNKALLERFKESQDAK